MTRYHGWWLSVVDTGGYIPNICVLPGCIEPGWFRPAYPTGNCQSVAVYIASHRINMYLALKIIGSEECFSMFENISSDYVEKNR